MAKIEVESLSKEHTFHKVSALVEAAGGEIRTKNYGGHEIRLGGGAVALMKNYTQIGASFYLHHTTLDQAKAYCEANKPEWKDRIILDKKGYDPARLVNITGEEIDENFLLNLKNLVEDGVRFQIANKKPRVRKVKSEVVAE
jgi:hypothetical protein